MSWLKYSKTTKLSFVLLQYIGESFKILAVYCTIWIVDLQVGFNF